MAVCIPSNPVLGRRGLTSIDGLAARVAGRMGEGIAIIRPDATAIRPGDHRTCLARYLSFWGDTSDNISGIDVQGTLWMIAPFLFKVSRSPVDPKPMLNALTRPWARIDIDGAADFLAEIGQLIEYDLAGTCGDSHTLDYAGGGEARMYHMVLQEIPPATNIPWDITQERPGYHIRAEVAFRDVDPSEYAGLFVSGGRAPEYLRYGKDLMRMTGHFFTANKPVAVVCHGIEIVSAAGVIRGRTVTTVAKCALDCAQGGAKYVNQPVVIDGNLVTARTWHDNAPFMREFMKKLASVPKK